MSPSVALARGVRNFRRRGSLSQAGKPRHRAGQALPTISLREPAGQRQGTVQLRAERRDLSLPGTWWAHGQVQVSQFQPLTGHRDVC